MLDCLAGDAHRFPFSWKIEIENGEPPHVEPCRMPISNKGVENTLPKWFETEQKPKKSGCANLKPRVHNSLLCTDVCANDCYISIPVAHWVGPM